MLAALEEGRIGKGDVIVIRFEGPKGGPGMPEMLTPTSAIVGAGLGSDRRAHHRRALLRRLARASSSATSCRRPRKGGGPIALVEDGDVITIDAVESRLDVDVSDEELQRRRAAWSMPSYKGLAGNPSTSTSRPSGTRRKGALPTPEPPRPPGRSLIRASPESHQLPAADADPCAVTGRTPASRFDVVSATPSASFGPCGQSQRRLGAPRRRKLVRFPG